MAPKRFWMIKGAGPTKFCHFSQAEAEAEANRLARSNPGVLFFVLEAVSAHVKVDVSRIDLRVSDENEEMIPF